MAISWTLVKKNCERTLRLVRRYSDEAQTQIDQGIPTDIKQRSTLRRKLMTHHPMLKGYIDTLDTNRRECEKLVKQRCDEDTTE